MDTHTQRKERLVTPESSPFLFPCYAVPVSPSSKYAKRSKKIVSRHTQTPFWSGALSLVHHPRLTIRFFLGYERGGEVFGDGSPARPQCPSRVGQLPRLPTWRLLTVAVAVATRDGVVAAFSSACVLEVRPGKIRGVVMAKQNLQCRELLPVAVGYTDIDLDLWIVNVVARQVQCPTE